MKKLEFQYSMQLEFDIPVSNHGYALRCVPHSDSVQKIAIKHRFVDPADCLDELVDGFGNHVYVGRCGDLHRHFSYAVAGEAVVDQSLRTRSECHPMYRYPSSLTGWSPVLADFLDEMQLGQESEFEKASKIMDVLYKRFTYAQGSTSISTTASQALEQAKGVCQDYTHIFLGLCRKEKIPCRYVAGLTLGEGATHAWAEIYVGDRWVGFDPTNNRYVDDIYIKLSHGRDYNDCVIDRGVFFGNASQKQEIYVNVEEIL